jgi:hypothetical protein
VAKQKRLGKGIEELTRYFLSDRECVEEEEGGENTPIKVVGCITPSGGNGFRMAHLAECLAHLGSRTSYQYVYHPQKNARGIIHHKTPLNSPASSTIDFHFLVMERGISERLAKTLLEIDAFLCLFNPKQPLLTIRSLGYLKLIGQVDPEKWIGIVTEGEPLPRDGIASINHLCRSIRQVCHVIPHYLGCLPLKGDRRKESIIQKKAYFRIAFTLYSRMMQRADSSTGDRTIFS